MAFRFIHSSDLHLGKGFGTMPEDLRGRLVEARHQALAGLVAAAKDHGAAHILLAGDTFDTTGPSKGVRRQAATAMSSAEGIDWWILPGNHDNLRGEELWRAFEEEAGANVHLLRRAEPVEIAPGVRLLPAPLLHAFPGEDLTGWMTGASTEGHLRIGLAHGGVTAFGEDFDSRAVIAPDRAAGARLDYLALGDWHGTLRVNDRTWYPGTPERDRFRHAGPGICLAVTLAEAGAMPAVREVPVGRFDWSAPDLHLSPEADVLRLLADLLPPDRAARRDTLMRIEALGFLHMADRGALDDLAAEVSPDFAWFQLRTERLTTEYAVDDLDLIASGGALRTAAEALQADATAEGGASHDARVAQAALNRLWALVREA